MSLDRLMFGILYRLGFTPWEGHPLPAVLKQQAESLPKGKALDIGCGTGESSVYLASQGWQVTAIDFVAKALKRAQARATAAGKKICFERADITKIHESGIGGGFNLLVDNGCLHSLADSQREDYVREVTAIAAPGATFVLTAFDVGGRRPPRGITQVEVEKRFVADWEIITHESSSDSIQTDRPLHTYVLRRRMG